jgi:hypothetical protein
MKQTKPMSRRQAIREMNAMSAARVFADQGRKAKRGR